MRLRWTRASGLALPTISATLSCMEWKSLRRWAGMLGAATCMELATHASTGVMQTCMRLLAEDEWLRFGFDELNK